MQSTFVLLLALFAVSSLTQFVPPVSYSSVLVSPLNNNITISYNSPTDACKTVFPSQKQYAGYIRLPPHTASPYQADYAVNTFFWFIEARQNASTAPLTIWFNGGPGSSSMMGLFQESGPCEVVQSSDGGYTTQPRMWGWDRSSNVLYIDQPVQVGFSYDSLTNASVDFLQDTFTSSPISNPFRRTPGVFLNGTFSSGNQLATANTSQIAAQATWYFLQTFLSSFPQYNPGAHANGTVVSSTGINMFAESYGGIYGPVFAQYFQQRNAERASGKLPTSSSLEINLASLGIINGLVDLVIQTPFYPMFAGNNTYSIQAMDQLTRLNALANFSSVGGCRDLITQCRAQALQDPNDSGSVSSVDETCFAADNSCLAIQNLYAASGLDYYDIRQKNPAPFPSPAYEEYLNYPSVQKAIGARVNFTSNSAAVSNAFYSTGDEARANSMNALSTLLQQNVRIAFIYGDADYICNWMGGEAISIALAQRTPTHAAFPLAGYASVVVNSSYVGGAVRQYGNLSFTRVYDSGHLVPAYQPETAFTLFTRIILGKDLSMGKDVDLHTYASSGDHNASQTNSAPPSADPTCWIREIGTTCTDRQKQLIGQGAGVVHDGVFYEKESDYTAPSGSATRTVQKGSPSSSTAATGVYVATGTPTPRKSAAQKSAVVLTDGGFCLWMHLSCVGIAVGLGAVLVG